MTEYRQVLLAGAGTIGVEFHVPRVFDILQSERLDIVDVSAARRAVLRQRFHGDARVQVCEQVPPSGGYDLVIIATPPRFHFEWYRALCERAPAFLIEKPMAMTAAEGRSLADLARRQGHKVWIHLPRRQLHNCEMLGQVCGEEYFGPLLKATVTHGGVFGWEVASAALFDRTASGGGVLMDTGPHVLDQLGRIVGAMRVVSAFVDCEPGRVESNCTLHLATPGAAAITVCLSRNRHLSDQVVLEFSKGVCRMSLSGDVIHFQAGNGRQWSLQPPHSSPSAFDKLMDSFYRDRILASDTVGVSPDDSLPCMDLIEAAYACARPLAGTF